MLIVQIVNPSALIFFEAAIADLIAAKGLTEVGMRAIHANLE